MRFVVGVRSCSEFLVECLAPTILVAHEKPEGAARALIVAVRDVHIQRAQRIVCCMRHLAELARANADKTLRRFDQRKHTVEAAFQVGIVVDAPMGTPRTLLDLGFIRAELRLPHRRVDLVLGGCALQPV